MKKDGFTLMEVMLASCILALGTLLLHQSYLRLADLYGRYVNGMRVQDWADEKIWEAREMLVYPLAAGDASDGGSVRIDSKDFNWNRRVQLLSGRGLYSIQMNVSWEESGKPASLQREVYAFRKAP